LEHRPELVQRLHDAWVQKNPDFPLLMQMTATAWPVELLDLARAVSAGKLLTLPFEEIARYSGWNRAERQHLLESTIAASRRPILPVGATLMPRCLCIVSREWTGLGGHHRQAEFFDLPVPVLLVISPIPVPSV
jgi:hypothetical protein